MLHQEICELSLRGVLPRFFCCFNRFHALRHTIASVMIDQGESDVAVALRLGHTNANTTRALYAQAFKAREASTAERAADAILNAK